MLGIIIGIAAVMTIVSTMEGMKAKDHGAVCGHGQQQAHVSVWNYWYDGGNPISKDYFPDLYDYCYGMKEYVVGMTPRAHPTPRWYTVRKTATICSRSMTSTTTWSAVPPDSTTAATSTASATI